MTRMQSSDFLAEAKRANAKERDRHSNQDSKVLPVFEKMRAAQNDGAAQGNEVGGRNNRTQGIKNPWHCFAWKNEAGKEDAGENEGHRHLQRLHLVFRFGGDEKSQAE